MKKVTILWALAFLVGCVLAAQGQDIGMGDKKYECVTGASYAGVIWNPHYPYKIDNPLDDRERYTYRKYKPTPAEQKAADADCDAAYKKYITAFAQGERRMLDEQEKNLQVAPARKADVAKVAACAKKHCATGMKDDSEGNQYFDYNGLRYTIGAGPVSLAIWVRPVGTTAKRDRKEYIDQGLDGTVDEGSEGTVQKYFKSWGGRPTGLQWRGHYQKDYNDAIARILEYVAANPKR